MAMIDKTAHRLCRTYSPGSRDDMTNFLEVMNGPNPFDHITVYFNDSTYCESEEELDRDREMKDGRWDPNVMTCDMLSLDKVYNPEFSDMYISRGSRTATMDWPFVVKDPMARYCDTEWRISFMGPFNDLDVRTHIIGAPIFKRTEVTAPNDRSKILHVRYDLTAGDFRMSFLESQLCSIDACHQNEYDRGYREEIPWRR